MRKNRNRYLAILLSCSLLTSMMPLSLVNVSAAENDMSVSKNDVSVIESPVSVPADVPEEALDAEKDTSTASADGIDTVASGDEADFVSHGAETSPYYRLWRQNIRRDKVWPLIHNI